MSRVGDPNGFLNGDNGRLAVFISMAFLNFPLLKSELSAYPITIQTDENNLSNVNAIVPQALLELKNELKHNTLKARQITSQQIKLHICKDNLTNQSMLGPLETILISDSEIHFE